MLNRIFDASKPLFPLYLEVDEETFVTEYTLATNNKSSDLTKVLEMITPYLRHWYKMLTIPSYPKDTNYQLLLKDDHLTYKDPLIALKIWVQTEPDLFSELQACAIETLRQIPNSFAKTAKAIGYVFSIYFRRSIVNQIKLALEPFSTIWPIPDIASDEYPDFLYLWNINREISLLERYILMLRIEGYTFTDIQKITNLNPKSLTQIERKLWQLLKKHWH